MTLPFPTRALRFGFFVNADIGRCPTRSEHGALCLHAYRAVANIPRFLIASKRAFSALTNDAAPADEDESTNKTRPGIASAEANNKSRATYSGSNLA
jgi:hypothetical protein